MEEEWKRIIIDGEIFDYEVSNFGNLRKYSSKKYINQYMDDGGYKKVNILNPDIDYKSLKFVHRLVAQAFIPNLDNLPEVNHINGIKTDNRVENLEWCTRIFNMKHASKNGLRNPVCVKGTGTWNNKYSEQQILKIIDLIKENNYTLRKISKITGVSYDTVKKINTRKQWKYLWENNISNEKTNDYSKLHNSIDRAILSNKTKEEIVNVLIKYGLSLNSAKTLYHRRKRKIKNNKSLVQNTIYIDNGIEIF